MKRRQLLILILGAGAISCSTTGSRAPTTRPPVSDVDSAGTPPAPSVRVLAPGTRAYRAFISTVSEERADSSPRRDSTQTTPRLLVSLQRVAGGAFLLQLQSEPWQSPVPDTTPQSSQSTRTGPTTPALMPVPLRLALDSLGMHATSLTQAGASCTTVGTEAFSPLGIRLLILPGLLHTRGNDVVRDSLTYRVCSSGTPLDAKLALEYTRAGTQSDSPSAASPIIVQLRGTIHGDSTRMLPMRLEGVLTGQAVILPDTGISALASSMTADYVLTLAAESSVKRQNFRQTIHLKVLSIPADSIRR